MQKLRPWLYQGDISDLRVIGQRPEVREKYGITLAVNVGHTAYVPPNFGHIGRSCRLMAVYATMADSEAAADNDWPRIYRLAHFVAGEVHAGGRVLVTCDAGLSRSVVFSGMVIAIVEGREMDADLFDEICTEWVLPGLWKNAADNQR